MRKFLFSLILCLLFVSQGWTRGAGSSTGKNLLQAPSARAAALGEAFSSVADDVTAFTYNPALLNSLKSNHASILYEQGVTDDFFTHIVVGAPLKKGSVGVNFGYYDGGDFQLFDGTTNREVKAQQDFIVGLGYALPLKYFDVGATIKYISTELGEFTKASTVTGDFGVSSQVHPRLRLGLAAQNIGGELEFVNEEEDLPELVRGGFSFLLFPGRYKTLALFELPYLLNEEEFRAAAGLETQMGPVALRLGYKSQVELAEFSVGAGFTLGPGTLDYSFGMADDVQDFHRVSLGARFGGFND